MWVTRRCMHALPLPSPLPFPSKEALYSTRVFLPTRTFYAHSCSAAAASASNSIFARQKQQPNRLLSMLSCRRLKALLGCDSPSISSTDSHDVQPYTINTCNMSAKAPSLVWIDCEMTGLLSTDKLIEIAVIITDDELNIVAEGPNLIIHQPKQVMDSMNEWCIEHHGDSGLTAAVLASNISTAEACAQVLSFIQSHIPQSRVGILAGNSVHADKVFLDREMKPIIDHLHYRIVDVSTVKELARRWYPREFAATPAKQGAHRAMDDIKESIAELKYYRSAVFK